jgi:hypothetical protein
VLSLRQHTRGESLDIECKQKLLDRLLSRTAAAVHDLPYELWSGCNKMTSWKEEVSGVEIEAEICRTEVTEDSVEVRISASYTNWESRKSVDVYVRATQGDQTESAEISESVMDDSEIPAFAQIRSDRGYLKWSIEEKQQLLDRLLERTAGAIRNLPYVLWADCNQTIAWVEDLEELEFQAEICQMHVAHDLVELCVSASYLDWGNLKSTYVVVPRLREE